MYEFEVFPVAVLTLILHFVASRAVSIWLAEAQRIRSTTVPAGATVMTVSPRYEMRRDPSRSRKRRGANARKGTGRAARR